MSAILRYQPEVAATTPTSGIEVTSFHFWLRFISGSREVASIILGGRVEVRGGYRGIELPGRGTSGSGDTWGQSFEVPIFATGYRSHG
jgi:hypothetical protein